MALLIKQWIVPGRFWYIHFGTPCTVFSIAKKKTTNGGRFKLSMKSATFTSELIRLCVDHGVFFALENPKTSRLFSVQCIRDALNYADAFFIEYDCCCYMHGGPFRKPTYLATNAPALRALGRRCQCGKRIHEHLRGR